MNIGEFRSVLQSKFKVFSEINLNSKKIRFNREHEIDGSRDRLTRSEVVDVLDRLRIDVDKFYESREELTIHQFCLTRGAGAAGP